MPWTRSRKTFVAIGFILVAIAIVAGMVASMSCLPANRRQLLNDGSMLTLSRTEIGAKIDFLHGNFAQKFLGNAIPSNGVHLGKLNLIRPTHRPFDSWNGKSWFVAEFKLSGPGSTNSAFVKPLFYRQFRCVIYGQRGIDYVEEFLGDRFTAYPDGFYGYVLADSFPRDSHWIGIRVEKRPGSAKPGPWQTVADFKIKNSSAPKYETWTGEPAPVTRSTNGLDFVLSQVTVEVVPHLTNDIWNHIVNVPIEVRSNGITLSNWHAVYTHKEDASGNWSYSAGHRSLDPRSVWKMDFDFEPWTNFALAELATVDVPSQVGKVVVTNVNGVPVSLSVDRDHLHGEIPTNRFDIALVFVSAEDKISTRTYGRSGNWGQHNFWKELEVLPGANTVRTTIAIVPNIHATFFTQPQLVTNQTNPGP